MRPPMKAYVDGFVLTVPTRNLDAYRRLAQRAGKVWCDHGALQYFECAGEDMNAPCGMVSFPKLSRAKPDETVIFAWAVFRSRKARDKANAAIMQDPRIADLPESTKDLFDCRRMAYGGFEVIVRQEPRRKATR